ncbi:MAG TPA: hypothetical protein VHO48_10510, partial [Anaerolineaceae bacterium]|nr:hypothetical protein [Anaerolineaceae bacterium]
MGALAVAVIEHGPLHHVVVALALDLWGIRGITLALGSNAIPSGQTGKVHLKVNRIDKVFYEGTDKDHPDYASAQFKPNWFNSDYADGVTYMSVTFHMPPGVQPEEPVYYPASSSWPGTSEPATGYDDQGRITYSWTSSSATPYGEYVFGAGFPAKYIPAGAIQKKPLIDPGLLICGLVGGLILVIVVGSIWLGITGERKRKMQYLPPKISIEGHGIKRGLTAVEAAILMQEPMDKIMTTVLFGVVKKNAATVLKRDPLELEVASPMPEGLHAYEIDFLKAFQETKPAERRKALQTMMVGL